ncbi:MAG: sodium-translocating pyrophosphatase [Candidatus Thorarchaeota archaeon]|nr:sodium-translocating pyrophosphatase [Candidatus Thorarchaeota archaeon]
MSDILFLSVGFLSGLLAIIVALFTYREVLKADEGNDRMREVSKLIQDGAASFIKIQYRILTIFTIVLAVVLALIFGNLGIPIAISYILGSIASMGAGYIGLAVATRANRRTAAAAAEGGLSPAFLVAFRAGSVMGLMIAGIALVGLTALYGLWVFLFPTLETPLLWEILTGFSFGASTVALFAKAGGGIFTKTADMSADIVGKIEQHIPEDDPRNPAAIADAVGDNVGDVAGTGADIFDSNVAAILAAALLGAGIDALYSPPIVFALLPLFIAGLGTIASVLGVYLVRPNKDDDPGPALNRGTYLTTILFGVFVLIALFVLSIDIAIALSAIFGLLAGVFIGFTSDVFTNDKGIFRFQPVKNMVDNAERSAANLILSGYSYGLLSAVPSVLGVVIALVASYILGSTSTFVGLGGWEGGIYTVAIAAVGLLATNGLTMSSDSYGPIVDNARGVIEQAHAPHEAIVACDKLDAAGNTAKAITKGFAIGSAALSVLALFAAFIEASKVMLGTELVVVNLADPFILAGAFIGALIPVTFSAMLILGVDRNAGRMIEEIRRQFREDPGIIEGTSKPDYDKCIAIATSGAIRELMPSTVLAIGVTVLTGAILGLPALGGYLAGAVIVGFIMALQMSNSGGAWDNAKKLIESPEYDHNHPLYDNIVENAIIGDMVGDPMKDTAGPSINTLLVVISLTATLFLPIIYQLNQWIFALF